jgi:hypothetical protein
VEDSTRRDSRLGLARLVRLGQTPEAGSVLRTQRGGLQGVMWSVKRDSSDNCDRMSQRIIRRCASLRCAVHASRKPWVTIRGHPSNACVRPLRGRPNGRLATMTSPLKSFSSERRGRTARPEEEYRWDRTVELRDESVLPFLSKLLEGA